VGIESKFQLLANKEVINRVNKASYRRISGNFLGKSRKFIMLRKSQIDIFSVSNFLVCLRKHRNVEIQEEDMILLGQSLAKLHSLKTLDLPLSQFFFIIFSRGSNLFVVVGIFGMRM